uniref:Uncharacterized protein n=1 Tax=Utricularia reniformis TaxID=192314 RepID=A0A1Y0B0P3_9LAMI|nr:hypothetical protein AEK19_MT0762 [Utricularia reniformis]ART31005.1 hypothetical protein AEK19_MT0762 [Utricularia reniformis]
MPLATLAYLTTTSLLLTSFLGFDVPIVPVQRRQNSMPSIQAAAPDWIHRRLTGVIAKSL